MGKCKTALSYTRYIDSERIRSDPRGKHLLISANHRQRTKETIAL